MKKLEQREPGLSDLKSNVSKKVIMETEKENNLKLMMNYSSGKSQYALALSRAEVKKDLADLRYLTSRQRAIVEGNVLEKVVSLVFGTNQSKLAKKISSTVIDLEILSRFVEKYETVRKDMTNQYFEKMAEKEVNGMRIYGYEQAVGGLNQEKAKILEDITNLEEQNTPKSRLARVDLAREVEMINQDIEEINHYQNACALKVCMADREIEIYSFYKNQANKILQMSKETFVCGQHYLMYASEHGKNLLTGSEILSANLNLENSTRRLKKEITSLEENVEKQIGILEKYDRERKIEEILPEPRTKSSKRYSRDSAPSWVDQAKLILERGS